MIKNELKTSFPFYDSIEKQNRYKINCYGDYTSFKLLTPKNRLLPFQLRREMNVNYLTSVLLYSVDGTYIDDLFPYIEGDISYATVSGKDYITYFGTSSALDLTCGYYYLVATDGTNTWYSEVFCVENFMDIHTDDYRAVSATDNRAVDNTDLRIINLSY